MRLARFASQPYTKGDDQVALDSGMGGGAPGHGDGA